MSLIVYSFLSLIVIPVIIFTKFEHFFHFRMTAAGESDEVAAGALAYEVSPTPPVADPRTPLGPPRPIDHHLASSSRPPRQQQHQERLQQQPQQQQQQQQEQDQDETTQNLRRRIEELEKELELERRKKQKK